MQRLTHGGLRRLRLSVALLVLASCGAAAEPTSETRPDAASEPPVQAAPETAPASPPQENRMWMKAGEHRFAITLEDSATARAFAGLLPVTLDMSELNGNEKYATLPKALPTSASRPGTIRNGDVMLYGADTLVVFYATFESSYSYTRIGRVDDPEGLANVRGAVRVEVSNGP